MTHELWFLHATDASDSPLARGGRLRYVGGERWTRALQDTQVRAAQRPRSGIGYREHRVARPGIRGTTMPFQEIVCKASRARHNSCAALGSVITEMSSVSR